MTKTITVGGKVMTLTSKDDGRTWVSKPRDLAAFRRRRVEVKRSTQRCFRGVALDYGTLPPDVFPTFLPMLKR